MNFGDSGGILTWIVEDEAWRRGIRLHWNLPSHAFECEMFIAMVGEPVSRWQWRLVKETVVGASAQPYILKSWRASTTVPVTKFPVDIDLLYPLQPLLSAT